MSMYAIFFGSNYTIRFDSTAVRLLIKGHQGYSDVTLAADQLAGVTLTHFII